MVVLGYAAEEVFSRGKKQNPKSADGLTILTEEKWRMVFLEGFFTVDKRENPPSRENNSFLIKKMVLIVVLLPFK